MSQGDKCKGCNHDRGAHFDIRGKSCPCGGGSCSCNQFQE